METGLVSPLTHEAGPEDKSVCLAVRIWDVRPFAPKERCVKIFQGNVHNFEKVTKNSLTSLVAAVDIITRRRDEMCSSQTLAITLMRNTTLTLSEITHS